MFSCTFVTTAMAQSGIRVPKITQYRFRLNTEGTSDLTKDWVHTCTMDCLNSYESRRRNLWFCIFCVQCNGPVLECLTFNHANLGSNVVLLFQKMGKFIHSTLLQFTQPFKRVHGYRQWWIFVCKEFLRTNFSTAECFPK